MPRGPRDFGEAFTALLRAAGTNPDGVRRALPGVVSRSVLYDWKNGEHLPSDTGPLVRVVELCLDRVRAGTALGSAPGDVNGWMELLAEAKGTRDSEGARGPEPGRPSGAGSGGPVEWWGPLRLGVHPVIRGGPLPAYTHRAHDHLLYAVLDPRVAANRLVVLRGGSSTGKSRAAYEAVRARLPNAAVHYPPSAAALDALLDRGIAARSVLWLNELRHYADDPGGQAVLARLSGLLPGRDHVLVVTSLWPEYWSAYTADPHARPGDADPVRASRALLAALPELTGGTPRDVDPALGGVIDVPEAFTAADLSRARRHGNALLDEAVTAAERAGSPGQLAQYLAGVPALLAHYRGPGADPYGHALITAAMDAVRLGCGRPLGRDLLQEAAVGYLADRDRAVTEDAWRQAMSRAWDNATAILRGAIRALEPVPPEHGIGVAGYRLTDYLDQFGRTHRKERIPPPSFWSAAARHAHPGDASVLAGGAYAHGLLRDSARLFKSAAAHGDAWAVACLVQSLRELHPADRRPVRWAAARAVADDPSVRAYVLARLLRELREAGEHERVGALAAQAAAHPTADDGYGLGDLLYELWKTGGRDHLTALLDRVSLATLSNLTGSMDAGSLVPGRLGMDWSPSGTQEATRFRNEVEAAVAERAAARLPLDRPGPVSTLLRRLSSFGRGQAALVLDRDPAARVSLDDPGQISDLLYRLEQLGATDQIGALLGRDPAAHVSLDDLGQSLGLLKRLSRAGAQDQADALRDRILSARPPLDDLEAVADLLTTLPEVGASDRLIEFLDRDPASNVPLDGASAGGVLALVFTLAEASPEQLAVLLDRDPAGRVSLDDPRDLAFLLFAFREVQAPPEQGAVLDAQIGVLAARAGANVRFQDAAGLAELLDELDLLSGMRTAEVAGPLGVLLDRLAHADAATVAYLLRHLGERKHGLAKAILDRNPAAHVTIPGPRSALRLLEELTTLAAGDQFDAFAARAAAQLPLDNLRAIIRLLEFLQTRGSHAPATVLAERAAADAPLTDPGAVADLIGLLETIGAPEPITVLLGRDLAARVGLDDVYPDFSIRSPDDPRSELPPSADGGTSWSTCPTDLDDRSCDVSSGVRRLLRRLARVGANDQVAALLDRLPAAGRFHDWTAVVDDPDRFRFGRERDGSPAAPWAWNDLRP